MIHRFDRPCVPLLLLAFIGCASLGSVSVQWVSHALVVRSCATPRVCRTQADSTTFLQSVSSGGEQDDTNGYQSTTTKKNNASKTNPTRSATSATRRDLLATALSVATAVTTTPMLPALAAEPIRARDTDSLLAIARRKLRPKPPKILRRKLSLDFAVLLMRSSYNALDEMDCVAMDQFQRDFFLIRGSEYETYTNNLGAGMVTQGDLTDPYYFDFISFAQYKTINREVMQDPPFVFEEQQIAPERADEPPESSLNPNGVARFVPVVVQRDPNLTNQLLIPTHEKKVGATILDKLEETFADTDSRIPRIGSRPDSIALASGIRQIVNLFLINGYAFKGDVSTTTGTGGGAAVATFAITLTAPATLWSGRVLQSEGDPLNNNFLAKTLSEYIRRSGYIDVDYSVKYEGTNEEITMTVR